MNYKVDNKPSFVHVHYKTGFWAGGDIESLRHSEWLIKNTEIETEPLRMWLWDDPLIKNKACEAIKDSSTFGKGQPEKDSPIT